MKRTEEEVFEQLDLAKATKDNTKFRGMTYEDGIIYAIEWLKGTSEDKPMDN